MIERTKMGTLQCDTSRCARLRSGTDACGKCLQECQAGALSVDDAIRIDETCCTACGCCAAACPSEALRWNTGLTFGRIIARVARRSNAVIACSTSVGIGQLDGGRCLGWLSEEHLCALASATDDAIQVDLTKCSECRNRHVPDVLRSRLVSAESQSRLPVSQKIVLVTDPETRWSESGCLGRRAFLSSWKELLKPELDGFPEENTSPLRHGDQVEPAKRKIIKWVAERQSDDIASRIADCFFGQLDIGTHCEGCGACVAACPTGALEQHEDDEPPELQPSLCVKCGACVLFCEEAAITMRAAEES